MIKMGEKLQRSVCEFNLSVMLYLNQGRIVKFSISRFLVNSLKMPIIVRVTTNRNVAKQRIALVCKNLVQNNDVNGF